MANKQLVGKWQSNNQSTAVIMFNLSTIMPLYYAYNVKLDVAVVDPWPINRTSRPTDSQENNAAAVKPAQDKICNYAIHKPSYAQRSRKFITTSEVVWSWLKSQCRCQVKSSRMWSSRRRSTWGHFSLKSGHVSVPQRLAGLSVIS